MMDMNFLKSLIARLDDTCRNALQAAAGLCLARTTPTSTSNTCSPSCSRRPTRTPRASCATSRSTRGGSLRT